MHYAKCICFLYVMAWLFGMAAFLLPYWISGDIAIGNRNVTVMKYIDSGLFLKRQTFYMKEGSVPDSDDTFADISGTYLYTEAVQIVMSLMSTGLVLLSISLMYSVYMCWCINKEKGGKVKTKAFIVIAGMTLLAGGFIVSGPVIYYEHVIRDYGVKKIHLGASCWLATISAVITFIVGFVNVFQGFRSICCVK